VSRRLRKGPPRRRKRVAKAALGPEDISYQQNRGDAPAGSFILADFKTSEKRTKQDARIRTTGIRMKARSCNASFFTYFQRRTWRWPDGQMTRDIAKSPAASGVAYPAARPDGDWHYNPPRWQSSDVTTGQSARDYTIDRELVSLAQHHTFSRIATTHPARGTARQKRCASAKHRNHVNPFATIQPQVPCA